MVVYEKEEGVREKWSGGSREIKQLVTLHRRRSQLDLITYVFGFKLLLLTFFLSPSPTSPLLLFLCLLVPSPRCTSTCVFPLLPFFDSKTNRPLPCFAVGVFKRKSGPHYINQTKLLFTLFHGFLVRQFVFTPFTRSSRSVGQW